MVCEIDPIMAHGRGINWRVIGRVITYPARYLEEGPSDIIKKVKAHT